MWIMVSYNVVCNGVTAIFHYTVVVIIDDHDNRQYLLGHIIS